MKKLMSLLLVAVMALGLFGCSKTTAGTTGRHSNEGHKKAAVDLDDVERYLLENAHGGEAGSKIVQGDEDAP